MRTKNDLKAMRAEKAEIEVGSRFLPETVESSLPILALRAEVADLKFQNAILRSENKGPQTERGKIRDENREEQRKVIQSSGNPNPGSHRSVSGFVRNTNAVAGPSRVTSRRSPVNSPHTEESHRYSVSRPRGQFGHSLKQYHNDFKLAAQNKLGEFDEDVLDLCAQLEDWELVKNAQRLFECGVCMEKQPEDYVALLHPCGHKFCRDCIRNYVGAKLEEHCFPIFCPVCMAEGGKGDPSMVTNALVQQVGITEQQYETWVELEMAAFSALLYCRKCKRSVFVDKEDLEDTDTISCPLPECDHVWCKACQQSISQDGPPHSCDGLLELDHLMTQSGWKYCPSCKTPIEKEIGCNHMTCISPGCNTHFCYTCGDAIIKSARWRDIKAATTAHYRSCDLFMLRMIRNLSDCIYCVMWWTNHYL